MHRIKSCFFLYFFFVCSAYSQQSFYEMGKKSIPLRDSLVPFTGSKSSGAFDYFSDSTLRINELFNHLLIQTNKNKLDVFQESIALSNLATFASTSQSLFSEDSKRKAAKTKRVKQILYNCKKSYGLITVHTFSFPIINYKGDFFYDKNGPDGGFNLYEKVKQKKDQEEKTEKEYIPLEQVTYEDISSMLEKKIRSTKIAS